ncbi:aKG-HExxH-type peptide beta-hydroxylase [Streptomyces sp. NRRL F-5126]|uniref:aKG-HExxH-type peptide beta-hydroxylase n=1 Tax=Streptomyces sp. NRRL F-5126 TaxID=1463857 RepID=UPI000B057924
MNSSLNTAERTPPAASGAPPFPARLLRELGRTEGGHDAIALLVRDQRARRTVRLRAVLDAAAAAPADVCPPAALDRLREHWALLEAAERADRAAVRGVLLHPLIGPWAQRCLYGLTAAGPGAVHEHAQDLDHFGALAAAAAARAGAPFATRLTAHGDLLVLPTLGALRTHPGASVELASDGEGLTLRQGPATPTVTVRTSGGRARSDAPRWLPLSTLPGLLPGAPAVVLDDLDPYRTAGSGLERHGLGAVTRLDAAARAAWAASWAGTEAVLSIGGAHRTTEAALLLRCLVPLARPPGTGPTGETASHCSGTRREAFGAVLCSRPSTPAYFAATLVHELQHTKLSALSAAVRLHDEGPAEAYFAPWRTDPRPFDGLLQGAYSHLALADYWQRYALAARSTTSRDLAWAEHARCAEQVAAVLPVLDASRALTPEGRVLVDEMTAAFGRLADAPPPAGHAARARAYVSTARAIWRQRHHSGGGGEQARRDARGATGGRPDA